MKKTLAVILCVCMMLALFAGCGESASTQQPAAAQTEAPAEPADENALPEQYDLIMTFGAETGSVYAMGIQIGEYINSIAPDITCTVKVGAAASNLALLSTGETVIAHSQSDTIHEAIVGEGNFTEPVTGIYAPDSGKIIFNGTDITGSAPHRVAQLGIGRTFQNIRLFSNLSVLSNVVIASNLDATYNLADAMFKTKKYKEREKHLEEKAMDLLEVVGLADKANEQASSLPYGHQRKLEIARAMALDPKLLLLDEPAAGMNAEESAELVSFVRQIRDRFDITILMIEHHMDVVSNLCDHVTVLNFGKTICVGTPEEVKSDPEVIRAYLGGE